MANRDEAGLEEAGSISPFALEWRPRLGKVELVVLTHYRGGASWSVDEKGQGSIGSIGLKV